MSLNRPSSSATTKRSEVKTPAMGHDPVRLTFPSGS